MQLAWYFFLATRPKTLLASLSPVILGCALAYKKNPLIDSSYTITTLQIIITACLIQILCNYVNDLWDYYKGGDGINRIGPLRVISSGKISPHQMKIAIFLLTIVIFIFGLILVKKGGLIILIIGIISMIGAFAYTAGPYPLAYHGLGEIFVLFFFGPIPVFGTHYLLTNVPTLSSAILGIPVGLIAATILLTNNIRDFKEDSASNKNTIAVKFGLNFSKFLFTSFLLISSCWPLLLLPNQNEVLIYLLSAIFIVISLILSKQLHLANQGVTFNSLLAKTSIYMFIFSLTLSTLIII